MGKRKKAAKTVIKCDAGKCCVYPKGATSGAPIRCFTRKKRGKRG